jgi:hypothetical protein
VQRNKTLMTERITWLYAQPDMQQNRRSSIDIRKSRTLREEDEQPQMQMQL